MNKASRENMVNCGLRYGSNDTGLNNGIRVQMMLQGLKLIVDDEKRQGKGNQKIKKPKLSNIVNLIGSITIGLPNGTTNKIDTCSTQTLDGEQSNDFRN